MQVTRANVKVLFLATLNGGSIRGWLKDEVELPVRQDLLSPGEMYASF